MGKDDQQFEFRMEQIETRQSSLEKMYEQSREEHRILMEVLQGKPGEAGLVHYVKTANATLEQHNTQFLTLNKDCAEVKKDVEELKTQRKMLLGVASASGLLGAVGAKLATMLGKGQ